MATKKKSPKTSSGTKSGKSRSTTSKIKYSVSFYHDWCKQCGLCMTFCPKKIITADRNGKPEIVDDDRCTGCRFCEMHCPDFAITVGIRTPKRRKTDE